MNELETHAGQAATLMKALAHKDRLMILCMLSEGERSVGELLASSSLSQSAFSQQLSVLRKRGIIKARKESLNIYYSIADENVLKIVTALHDIYCK